MAKYIHTFIIFAPFIIHSKYNKIQIFLSLFRLQVFASFHADALRSGDSHQARFIYISLTCPSALENKGKHLVCLFKEAHIPYHKRKGRGSFSK